MNTEKNRASWAKVVHDIDHAPAHAAFNRLKTMVSPILHRAILAQFDCLFEADGYFNHIKFFPPNSEGSRKGPRVTLELRAPIDPHLYISLCDWDIQYQSPAQCIPVMPDAAFPTFTRYLQHLWEETVPEPIPDALRRKENYVP
jgi:hypothetical protein